jgi:hypothetical protein
MCALFLNLDAIYHRLYEKIWIDPEKYLLFGFMISFMIHEILIDCLLRIINFEKLQFLFLTFYMVLISCYDKNYSAQWNCSSPKINIYGTSIIIFGFSGTKPFQYFVHGKLKFDYHVFCFFLKKKYIQKTYKTNCNN